MKTSNKLLLGLLVVILIIATTGIVVMKVWAEKSGLQLSGVTVTQEKQIDEFSELNLAGGILVHFTQNSQTTLSLTGDSVLVANVRIEQNGSKLNIKLEENTGSRNRVEVFINNPKLSYLDVVAGAHFQTENSLQGNIMKMEAIAGGKISMTGDFNVLDANVTAGGMVNLTGNAERARFGGTAGGQIDALEFTSQFCKVNVVAGAIAEVYASQELRVSANAGGIVKYKGNPKLTDIDISSGGRLNDLDD